MRLCYDFIYKICFAVVFDAESSSSHTNLWQNEFTKEIPMDRIELKWNSKRKIFIHFSWNALVNKVWNKLTWNECHGLKLKNDQFLKKHLLFHASIIVIFGLKLDRKRSTLIALWFFEIGYHRNQIWCIAIDTCYI